MNLESELFIPELNFTHSKTRIFHSYKSLINEVSETYLCLIGNYFFSYI